MTDNLNLITLAEAQSLVMGPALTATEVEAIKKQFFKHWGDRSALSEQLFFEPGIDHLLKKLRRRVWRVRFDAALRYAIGYIVIIGALHIAPQLVGWRSLLVWLME